MNYPRVAIIILNWNNYNDTKECFKSLETITYPNYEVIVVDNGSTDASGEKLKKGFPQHTFIQNKLNLGFAGGNNIGIKYAFKKMPDFILLLNNDTIVDKGFLEPAIEVARMDNTIGIVGGKIYYYSNPKKIWSAGGFQQISWGLETIFGLYGHNQIDKGQFDMVRKIDWCVGACMLIKREVFEKIGLLPECYFLCKEEGEFAVKAYKAGFKIFYTPKSVIWHKVGISSVNDIRCIYNGYRNRLLFIERNYPLLVWWVWFLLFRVYINFFALLRWKMTKRHENVNIYSLQKIAKLACNDHKKRKKITEEDLEKAEQTLSACNRIRKNKKYDGAFTNCNNLINVVFINCDLCGCNNNDLLFQARDYRFGQREEYNVVKCNNCGLIYINPRPTTGSMLKLYEENYTPEDNLPILPKLETKKWKISLKKFWHRINGQYIDEIVSKAEGKVLDVGCGNGHLLVLLEYKDCEVYGVEINPKSVNICNKLGLKVFCGTLEEAKFSDGFFDTVVMSQVLEHLPSPKASLREIFRILEPSGKVFIYCPNAGSYLRKLFGKYWHGWHIPFHFYAFTQQTIKKLAESTGFKVEDIFTVTPGNFFTTSVKSYLYGRNYTKRDYRPIDKGKYLDSLAFRAFISAGLRILDFITPNKGDCLKVKLVKR